jgi:hypothetical protein
VRVCLYTETKNGVIQRILIPFLTVLTQIRFNERELIKCHISQRVVVIIKRVIRHINRIET